MSGSSEATARKLHSEGLLRPTREEPPRPERVCPNCGASLIERKCKLLCPDPACGYYMSCSDFY
jgi:hypothetical protein